MQSANPDEASSSVYMLGRALGGVQDQQHASVLADQLWPLVSPSLLQHSANSACRRAGVQFFLSVIPRLRKTAPPAIEAQMLDMCVWWYEKELAPDVLTCCSRLISHRRGNSGFQALLEHAFEVRKSGIIFGSAQLTCFAWYCSDSLLSFESSFTMSKRVAVHS